MLRKNRPERKEQRRADAVARQAERDARTPTEQIQRLVNAGHGHCAEVVKLTDRVA